METASERLRRRVAEGEQRIEKKWSDIVALRGRGVDATQATRALDKLKTTQATLRGELARAEARTKTKTGKRASLALLASVVTTALTVLDQWASLPLA